jgi:hypothetical protein
MIFRWSVAIGRQRRKLLVTTAVLVGTALLARLFGANPDDLAPYLAIPAFGVLVTALVVMFAPSSRRPPASFVITEGEFRTPLMGIIPLAGIAHLACLGVFVLYPVESPTAALAALLYVCYLRAQWHGVGLTLTPEGLRADKYAGSMTVPWTALEPGQPGYEEGGVRLALAHPELAGYTGVVLRRTVLADAVGVPAAFLAAAIRHYAAHPGERAGIGTLEGHERLLAGIARRGAA